MIPAILYLKGIFYFTIFTSDTFSGHSLNVFWIYYIHNVKIFYMTMPRPSRQFIFFCLPWVMCTITVNNPELEPMSSYYIPCFILPQKERWCLIGCCEPHPSVAPLFITCLL